jgi:hypothetical protein
MTAVIVSVVAFAQSIFGSSRFFGQGKKTPVFMQHSFPCL